MSLNSGALDFQPLRAGSETAAQPLRMVDPWWETLHRGEAPRLYHCKTLQGRQPHSASDTAYQMSLQLGRCDHTII